MNLIFIIKDWAGNDCFNGMKFPDFENAEEYLSNFIDGNGWNYEEIRQEYDIEMIERSEWL